MGVYYLSGPMTGLPDNNKPAFNEAARVLRKMGHFVINPAEMPDDDYEEMMARDINIITNTPHLDGLILLPGWEDSPGSLREREAAIEVGVKVFVSAKSAYVIGNDIPNLLQSAAPPTPPE